MIASSAEPSGAKEPKATSWQRTPLERVTDEEIALLNPESLDGLISLFEQFVEESNPPTKKMAASARLQLAKDTTGTVIRGTQGELAALTPCSRDAVHLQGRQHDDAGGIL